MDFIFESNFWFAVLRSATPVLFATLAALIATKSGVLNLALEGTMLVAALAGVVGSAFSGSVIVGMFSGMLAGLVFTLILAYCSLTLKTNQVITGVALNLAASGGTIFILFAISGDKSMSASLNSLSFPKVEIPGLANMGFIGDVLSGHNVLTYLALILVVVIYVVLNKTKLGIKIRAVGESSEAAESVGINPTKIKYFSFACSGLLASFGGMFLSMGYISMFTSNMTAGRGYIALATNAMSGSNPIKAFIFSLVYAFSDAAANFMQSKANHLELIQMAPYVFIIVVFVLFSYKQKKKSKEENYI